MDTVEVLFNTDKNIDDQDVNAIIEFISSKGLCYKSIRVLDRGPKPIHDGKTGKPTKSCCGQGKKSPSILKKAQNYTKTMTRWIKTGSPIVNMNEFADRLAVCGNCESLKGYECIECGCLMDSKAKMNIDNLCELNKW